MRNNFFIRDPGFVNGQAGELLAVNHYNLLRRLDRVFRG